mmetsp:Transcript_23006/g.51880  ORF Transcript_23006/g.51880 Transcript_23006/m.51880 type:complete len:641 (+) Transcript_23006:272-2194(+)
MGPEGPTETEIGHEQEKPPVAIDVKPGGRAKLLQSISAAEEKIKLRESARPTADKRLGHFKDILDEPWYLINPDGNFMQKWDSVTTLALLFTAIVTPYEVACLGAEAPADTPFLVLLSDGLWVINQLVNLVFVVDMFLSFQTMYRESARRGGGVVKDLRKIRRRYVRGWFAVDVVSIVPFSYIPGAGSLGILRVVRVLRLLKLARMLRASRIYQRFQARNSMPHSVEAMVKLIVILMVVAHWAACAWAMTATLQASSAYTWLDGVAEGYYCDDFERPCPDDGRPARSVLPGYMIYYAAIYWSVTTITSVGYGDITPKNFNEMAFAAFFELFLAVVWAYIIGNAVTIISTGDPVAIEHHQTMDALNKYIAEKQLPEQLRQRLRRYLRARKALNNNKEHQELLTRLSPKLMEDTCESTSSWLKRVSIFAHKDVSLSFLVNVSFLLEEGLYEPKELIPWKDSLNGITRGVASVHRRICPIGYFWGEDFILECPDLKDKRPANAFTYVCVVSIERGTFMNLLGQYPIETKIVRRCAVKLAFKRAVLAWAARDKADSDQSALASAINSMIKYEMAGTSRLAVSRATPEGLILESTQRLEAKLDAKLNEMAQNMSSTTRALQERFESQTAELSAKLDALIAKLDSK